MSKTKRQEIHEIFALLDTDQKGFVSIQAVQREILRTIGVKPSQKSISANFRCMDPGNRGDLLGRQAFLNYATQTGLLDDQSVHLSSTQIALIWLFPASGVEGDDGVLAAEIGCGMLSFLRTYWRKAMLNRLFEGGAARDALIQLSTPTDALFRTRMQPIRLQKRNPYFDDIAFTKKIRAREEQRKLKLAKTQSLGPPHPGTDSIKCVIPLAKTESAPVQKISRLSSDCRMNSLTLFLEEGDTVSRTIETFQHTLQRNRTNTKTNAPVQCTNARFTAKKLNWNSFTKQKSGVPAVHANVRHSSKLMTPVKHKLHSSNQKTRGISGVKPAPQCKLSIRRFNKDPLPTQKVFKTHNY